MKQNHFFLLLGILGPGWLLAQESAVASGGSASGANGSATYSVGQVAYTEISGPTGSAIQGVQQPYEIYALPSKEHPSIKLEAMVYPNPTQKDIILRIVSAGSQNFSYELFDMHGRILAQDRTGGVETSIPLERYEAGTYILKVLAGHIELKSFKIIKHKI